MRDNDPPNGIERRQHERRLADRRRGAERRRIVRRADGSARPSGVGMRSFSPERKALPQQFRAYGPVNEGGARTPKILRVLLVAGVAIGCLLAATLENAKAATTPKPKTGVVTKTADGTTATLAYVRSGSSATGGPVYGQLRLTVRAAGRTTLRRLAITGKGGAGYLARPQLTLSDLTGDGVDDVIVDIFTGGAHCCSVSTIVRSTPKSWGRPLVHDWRDNGYQLKDAGGSSTPELIADDSRFTGAYTAYAGSAEPIRIFSLEGGLLKVVTTQFPDWIRQDVTQQETQWQESGKLDDPQAVADAGRAAAAAWIADLVLLGDYDAAKAVFAASQARGDLKGNEGFGGQLGHDLKAWGYLTDPAVIGLTDAPIS